MGECLPTMNWRPSIQAGGIALSGGVGMVAAMPGEMNTRGYHADNPRGVSL